MTYIFDENLSPRIARALALLDLDVHHVNDEYHTGIKDTDFLPDVGQKGWVLITCDQHVRTRPLEVDAYRRNGVRAVIMGEQFPNQRLFEQARWFFLNWAKIEAATENCCPGSCFKALHDSVEPLPWELADEEADRQARTVRRLP